MAQPHRQPGEQTQLAGPDLSRPYVVLNDDGTWGSEVYYKVRDLRPGVGEFMRRRDGGLCEFPLHRMKLVAFEADPEPEPTPEEKAAKQDRKQYRSRSRVTSQQRKDRRASDPQCYRLRRLCHTLGLSEPQAAQMVGARCTRFEELRMWQAHRLIDRLQEV